MAILRVERKNKLTSKVSLEPKRKYVSGSLGVSGEIYVFPNRSPAQKDNIDERLSLAPIVDGSAMNQQQREQAQRDAIDKAFDKIVKPYSANSLEARRLEIYAGNFNKFDNQLIDATQYQYEHENIAGTLVSGSLSWSDGKSFTSTDDNVFADTVNAFVAANPAGMGIGDKMWLVKGGSDPNEKYDSKPYVWTSNYYWERDGEIYNKLPVSTRDTSALNYEPALALLLDGADPESLDHAWRQEAGAKAELYQEDPSTYSSFSNYSVGNSSLTGGTASNYQFSGWVTKMEDGFPTQVRPVSSKEEVNAWPPELDKWGTSVITNYMIQGYSDLSMHPRNKTKKLISFERSNQEYSSPASQKGRLLWEEFQTKGYFGEGYRSNNSHSLSLSTWSDGTTTYTPALVYPQPNREFEIEYSTAAESFNFEFWIKPDALQTDVGTICQLHGNYALLIIPDTTTVIDGVAQNYKISLRVGGAANDGVTLSTSQTSDLLNNIYVSNSLLTLDTWHHVSIRWGRNFNNGQFVVFIDGIKRDSVEGVEAGSRAGLIETGTTINTTNHALFVGGYPKEASPVQRQIWEEYSTTQSGIAWNAAAPSTPVGNTVNANTGIMSNLSIRYQLKSELTELRCWDYPRTEKEIVTEWRSRADTRANMRFYIPFYFEPATSTTGVLKRPRFKPDVALTTDGFSAGTSPFEKYYGGSGASISQVMQPLNQTQYCSNWGHIGGVPLINVAQHAKEYKTGYHPVILGIPNLMKIDKTEVYPNPGTENYVAVSEEKINYFKDRWPSIPWLRCLNSMIYPATVDLGSTPSKIVSGSSGFYRHNASHINHATTGSVDFSTANQTKYMFDDDAWLTTAQQFYGITTGSISYYKDEDYLTSVLVDEGKIYDKDVLTPFAPVISIPILYYGQKLEHEEFSLTTTLPSGKTIKLVDQNNQLWIADKNGAPTVGKAGHISYQNGFMQIFSPLLSDITLNETTLEFRGSKDMYVLQFDVRCPPGVSNESNNVNFKDLKASANANETDTTVTYISTVYLHDENLNVIGKVKLAQPIQKREEDSFLFRIKMDF